MYFKNSHDLFRCWWRRLKFTPRYVFYVRCSFGRWVDCLVLRDFFHRLSDRASIKPYLFLRSCWQSRGIWIWIVIYIVCIWVRCLFLLFLIGKYHFIVLRLRMLVNLRALVVSLRQNRDPSLSIWKNLFRFWTRRCFCGWFRCEILLVRDGCPSQFFWAVLNWIVYLFYKRSSSGRGLNVSRRLMNFGPNARWWSPQCCGGGWHGDCGCNYPSRTWWRQS